MSLVHEAIWNDASIKVTISNLFELRENIDIICISRRSHHTQWMINKNLQIPGVRDAIYMSDILIFDYLRVLRLNDYIGGYLHIWIAGNFQFEKRTDLFLAQLSVNSLRSVYHEIYKCKLRLLRILKERHDALQLKH